MKKTRILAFDLNTGIWPHSMMLNKTLGQLTPELFEISLLGCGSLFRQTCTVMESRGRGFSPSSSPKSLDCKDCKFTANFSGHWLQSKKLTNSSTQFLSDYLPNAAQERAIAISSEIADRDLDLETEFCGVPVVRYALHETVLRFKKLNHKLQGLELEHFRSNLENCILTILAGKEFLERNGEFDIALIHSPEYGSNNCFATIAAQHGSKIYAIRSSWNLAEMNSSVVLHDWNFKPHTHVALRNWPGWEHIQPSKADLRRVRAHIQALQEAKSPFVYSPPSRSSSSPQETRELLGIKDEKPTILLSINSTDEIMAGKTIGHGLATNYPGAVFNSQFDWVSQTIDWISKKPDINLVVRLHPRDLPNKREKVLSEQHSVWRRLLSQLPPNVYLNDPSQELSFGQVCGISSVVSTGWSSTAFEAMLMNRPVVTYDSRLPAIPADIHRTGSSIETYFNNLNEALVEGLDESNSVKAMRWMVHSLSRDSVELSGGLFNTLRTHGPIVVRKLFSGLDRYFFFLWRPLELIATFRKARDSKRIETLLRQGNTDFFM